MIFSDSESQHSAEKSEADFSEKILNWLELSNRSGVYERNYTVMIAQKYSEDT